MNGSVPALINALNGRRIIDAIKQLRSLTGLGLRESKDIIEAIMPTTRAVTPPPSAEPSRFITLVEEQGAWANWAKVYDGTFKSDAMSAGRLADKDGGEVIVACVIACTKRTLVEVA